MYLCLTTENREGVTKNELIACSFRTQNDLLFLLQEQSWKQGRMIDIHNGHNKKFKIKKSVAISMNANPLRTQQQVKLFIGVFFES